MTTTHRITGSTAIDIAELTGRKLSKYEDPTAGAREGLTADEARDIAQQDEGLIYVSVETEHGLSALERHGAWGVEDAAGGIWWATDEVDDIVLAAKDPAEAAIVACILGAPGEWHN